MLRYYTLDNQRHQHILNCEMETTPAQKAVNLALAGNWQEAAKVNLEILKETPDDLDALNRLARAYSELGKTEKARSAANKVLKIDPLNTIALKDLEKWKSGSSVNKHTASAPEASAFLEESGKTKLVPLMHPGDAKLFANLDSGDEVKLLAHAHRVSIVTPDGKYIGRLPDDLSARLRNLIKAGNKYQAIIKSIEPKEVTVFIRETERGKNSPNISSFPQEKIDYVSFTPPELIHKEQPEMLDPVLENPEEI